MHDILLPRSRITRIVNSYRHPDQAALLARLPLAGRRVPFRQIWRRRGIDPRRIVERGSAAVRSHLPAAAVSRQRASELVRAHLPEARARAAAIEQAAARVARTGGGATVRGTRAIAARRGRVSALFAVFALGALLMYFFDTNSGRRRRALVRDKLAHGKRVFRRDVPRIAQRRTRFLGGVARGVRHHAAGMAPHRRGHVDDDTLVARVRSEVLRRASVKAGEIHVDAYEGCVTLRGQLEHEDEIRRIVEATGRIDGVTQVRSYLHLPGTPPPNKAEAMENGHIPQHIAR